MKVWKILFLIISLLLIFGGWLGYNYFSFQIKLNEKISAKEWSVAENILDEWRKTKSYWLLKNIPHLCQKLTFQKGWLLAQRGNYEEALKEFRKIDNPDALYNATTLALVGGRESLKKLIEEYIKVLRKKPDDFQAKINLEILLQEQEQEKIQMSRPGQNENEKKTREIKQFRPKKESEGQSGSENQGIRY
jgi:tetratricopeptide (TPR) repeat protein